MTPDSSSLPELTPERRAALERLLGGPPERIEPLRGGGNNRVLRVVRGGVARAAKLYFAHPGDPRDRLGAEFGMLAFLWRHGVRCLPEPLAADPAARIGLYGFVAGTPLAPGAVTAGDVAALGGLLRTMWRLRGEEGAAALPPSSEASFSLQAYLDRVARRLARVRAALELARPDGLEREAAALVQDGLAPAWAEARDFVAAGAARAGVGLADELPVAARTLSPDDHGFHNALRVADGSLVFLDFEYAGWDDPAQMLGNACLQPAVPLPDAARPGFLRGLLDALGGAQLAGRLKLVYPVLALKWALIMLNEFVPLDRERRAFARTDPRGRRAAQLAKARRQLKVVREAIRAPEGLLGAPGAAAED